MISFKHTPGKKISSLVQGFSKTRMRYRVIKAKHQIFRFCYLLFCLLLVESCVPCYYTPNAQNVPLFKGKKEGMVNFSFQGGLYSRGLNIQAAFSATDHIGLFLNYHHYGAFYTNDAILVSTSGDGHFRGNFGEAGIGYFFTFHEKWIFETYGGMGLGNVQNEKTDDSYYFNMPYRSAKVRYHRYFVQPAIGWVLNEHFELAVSSRLCLLNYKDVSIGSGDDMDIYQLTGIENNPLFLFEPAFTLRVGGKNVKFQYQLSYSENFGNHEENFDPFGVSFAVFFKIHGKKK